MNSEKYLKQTNYLIWRIREEKNQSNNLEVEKFQCELDDLRIAHPKYARLEQ